MDYYLGEDDAYEAEVVDSGPYFKSGFNFQDGEWDDSEGEEELG